MTQRKGQLQALEPIIIVIVLAVIIGLVMLFYVRFTAVQQTEDKVQYQAQEDIAMLGRITTLPELSCPTSETGKTYCLDLLKSQAFATIMQDAESRTFYNPLFGSTNLTLKWYDLERNEMQSLQLYYNLRNRSNIKTTTTYFTVFEPVNSTRQFAMLIVERQS